MKSDPKDLESFNRKFQANTYFEPGGMETVVHLPCPFCGGMDFVTFPLADFEMIVKLESVCRDCERGCRLDIKPIAHNGVRWEFLQTQGEDPPAYLPEMRRAEAKKGGDA